MIDLRSDTVTIPSYKMREAMSNAILGDDVYEEDPTVKCLEKRVALMFCKGSSLFFPSGTMCNLTAVLSWCSNRGAEIIVGDNSHMFLFEQAGVSQFGGVSQRTVPNLPDGTMNIDSIRSAIRDDDIHEPITELICIENTHNACGGKVLPISFLEQLKELSDKHLIPIHLDGARIWNALVKSKTPPQEISQYVDSLSVCLTKGLGAPVGSLLVGSTEFIQKARRIRKALGGGMRQVGILAAAGLKALDDFESSNNYIFEDHIKTVVLAEEIRKIKAFKLSSEVDTNIIFMDIILYDKSWDLSQVSSKISELFKKNGVLVCVWSSLKIRLVLHKDITHENVEQTKKVLKEISAYLETLQI